MGSGGELMKASEQDRDGSNSSSSCRDEWLLRKEEKSLRKSNSSKLRCPKDTQVLRAARRDRMNDIEQNQGVPRAQMGRAQGEPWLEKWGV